MTFAQFKKNELVIDAVVRNLEIIGEACNAIPKKIQNANPQIPWKQIIGLRNILIHQYFGIDINAVWQTIEIYLPELEKKLKELST